jgi:outer membrane protein
VNCFTSRIVAIVLAVLVAWSGVVEAQDSGEAGRRVRVGAVTDGPRMRSFNITEMLQTEIRDVSSGSYSIEFPGDAALHGDWSPQGITGAINELLARDDIDVVLAVGVASAAAACGIENPRKPIVVPFSFAECNPVCARSPNLRVNTVGLNHLTARDLRAFHEVVPYTRVAVLSEPSWTAGCDTERVAATIALPGTEVRFVSMKPGDTDVVDDLPEGTDAVYLMRMQQIDDAGFRSMVDGLTRAGIPTFSLIGEMEVEQGVLAGLNTVATTASIIRGAAVDVLDLLDGRISPPSSLGEYGTRLTVNMATAETLRVGVTWEVLSNARLLHEEAVRAGESIDLGATLDRAVDANLDLLVQDRVVSAGSENIRDARSSYGPQLGLAENATAIDSDRAFAALGNYQRFAAGSLALTQLIYSDGASANITIQKELQQARKADREAVRLDITRVAAEAYLDLLRAESLVRIRGDDVALNRANLDVARLRHSMGAAASNEIYRWEAQLAAARAALLESYEMRRLAERQLIRLLDRSVTMRWRPRVTTLEHGLEVLGGSVEAALLDTPYGFSELVPLLLEQGIAESPELTALDSAVAAQQRAHTAARRVSYAPKIGFSAQLDQIVAKDEGGGTDLGPIGAAIPGVDDTLWALGLRAELPLSAGGAIKARRIQTNEELQGLLLERRSVRQKLSQRILSALDQAAASWPAITLRRESADAAAKSLELVQDAYARGAASILDLLDAQNAALTAEFAAETSVYVFLNDWAEVRRSIAKLGAEG